MGVGWSGEQGNRTSKQIKTSLSINNMKKLNGAVLESRWDWRREYYLR